MKRIKIVTIALILVVAGTLSADAQKIGYVSMEPLVYSLPEIQKVKDGVEKYQRDSIGPKYDALSKEYKEKDSVYRNPKTVSSVKNLLEKDLMELTQTLQNWEQIAGNLIQGKQNQLLAPLVQKVRAAIDSYSKEKGYTYVLHPDALIVAPPADDITEGVATKLGIKLPAAAGVKK